MIIRRVPASCSTCLSFLLSSTTARVQQVRRLHASLPTPPVPSPTPFVPDAPTFLKLIGRKLSTHAAKIPSWEALFTLTSSQLRELGVEPARTRRYLLWWREKFRRGEFGIGGDLKEVADGVGEVRVLQEGERKWVANAKEGESGAPVIGLKIRGAATIMGSHFKHVKGTRGSVARIKQEEGMWEVRRGRKIHGGERRRKNVLSRIAARERGTLK